MAAGGSTQQTLRKAIGAIKDSTTVGLVKVNSDNKGLDIAIVKATSHDEELPKERYVGIIIDAVADSRFRNDISYCVHSLAKRLAKTHTWTVALKTLIVIHRALMGFNSTFREELTCFSRGRGLMLNLSRFRDDSSPQAWECSAWVRTYALYLEEHLECFRVLKFDVFKDQPRDKTVSTSEFLEQLAVMQQLLSRLLCCKPDGAALFSGLVHYALSIVASESVKLYVAITDRILKLVDMYFEMKHHDALKALQIYRKAGTQAESLSDLFEVWRGLSFGRGQKYVKIEQPPTSFLASMEEYVKKDAPQVPMLEWIEIKDDQTDQKVESQPATLGETADLLIDYEDDGPGNSDTSEPASSDQISTVVPIVVDLLSMDEPTEEVSGLEENDPLAAIVPPDGPLNSESDPSVASQTPNWELQLVPPSSTDGAAANKLANVLDNMTLDRLYESALVQPNQNTTYQTEQMPFNPFEIAYNDPNTNPNYMQMTPEDQQQHMLFMQHQQEQHQVPDGQRSKNPFEDSPSEQSATSQSQPQPQAQAQAQAQAQPDPFAGLI